VVDTAEIKTVIRLPIRLADDRSEVIHGHRIGKLVDWRERVPWIDYPGVGRALLPLGREPPTNYPGSQGAPGAISKSPQTDHTANFAPLLRL
jgi:hypothetical protein